MCLLLLFPPHSCQGNLFLSYDPSANFYQITQRKVTPLQFWNSSVLRYLRFPSQDSGPVHLTSMSFALEKKNYLSDYILHLKNFFRRDFISDHKTFRNLGFANAQTLAVWKSVREECYIASQWLQCLIFVFSALGTVGNRS